MHCQQLCTLVKTPLTMKKITTIIIQFSLIYLVAMYLFHPQPETVFYNIGSNLNKAQQQFSNGLNEQPKKVKIFIPAISKDSITLKQY